MGVLFFRDILHLETSEDTFRYHIHYAAMRANMGITYQVADPLDQRYLGFPPLPHFCQGMLWKISGSVNAIALANYFAFCIFLIFCHIKLRADFRLTSLIALTSPLVLIHINSGYIDLFSNSFLAIGICSFVSIFYFDKKDDFASMVWGLAGLAGASWSKFQLVPLCALFFLLYLVIQIKFRPLSRNDLRKRIVLIGLFIVLATIPYIKNTVRYGNPFWPIEIPYFEKIIPYSEKLDSDSTIVIHPELKDKNNFIRFFLSLFQVYNPTEIGGKARWHVDQGGHLYNTKAFRMGGFWNVAVVIFNCSLFLMAILLDRKKGIILLIGNTILYSIVALLPQSYELRYYLFLPLCWAAIISMIFPRFQEKYRKTSFLLLFIFLALFLYISFVNKDYYKMDKTGYVDIGRRLGFEKIWNDLAPGKTYCVKRRSAETIFLSGPTMTEFNIIVTGDNTALCPVDGKFISLND
jgi:hypothetical protein